LQPLFFLFWSPSGKIMPQKQMLITILGRKKAKKEKKTPLILTRKKGFFVKK
jgi:hypothetical protein